MTGSNQQKYMPWVFITLGIAWTAMAWLLGRMGT